PCFQMFQKSAAEYQNSDTLLIDAGERGIAFDLTVRRRICKLPGVWVLPTGFLKHCIHRTYSDTKNGGNCPSGAMISKDIFANFASLRLCEKKTLDLGQFLA